MGKLILPCSPFAVGDTVYILGKYMVNAYSPLCMIEAKISHIDHKQFVAYGLNGYSEWRFSKKHYNKAVFKDKEKAIEEFNRRVGHEPAGECAERGSWCGEEGEKG